LTIRVCQVVSTLRTGGMERMVSDLLAGLREDHRLQTTDYRPQTRKRQAETTDYRLQTTGAREETLDIRLQLALHSSACRNDAGTLDSNVERRKSHAVIRLRPSFACELWRAQQGFGGQAGAATGWEEKNVCESCLFCTDAEGELYTTAPAVAKACGHREPGWFIIDWRLVRQMVRFVREQRVDLLHAHNHAPNLYGTIVSLLTGTPVVVTRHGQGYTTLRWKILSRVLSWRSKVVVFVSEDARRLAVSTGSVSPRKAIVIHNGVDTRRFAPGGNVIGYSLSVIGDNGSADYRESRTRHKEPVAEECTEGAPNNQQPITNNDAKLALRAKLGIPSNAVVIGSVGRLSPEKNYPLLVRAFAKVARAKTTDYRPQTTDQGGGETLDLGLQTLDCNGGWVGPGEVNAEDRRTECASHIEEKRIIMLYTHDVSNA